MKKITQILGIFMLVISVWQIKANDIQIHNTSIVQKDMENSYAIVNFDLEWKNSWRVSSAQSNWDAAWIFIKFRINEEGEWKHAKLSNNGHNIGTGTSALMEVGLLNTGESYNIQTNPGLGVFIYRSGNSLPAPFAIQNAQLKWDFSNEEIENINTIEIKVFAIEMVYVPQSSFYLGSGGNEIGRFYHSANSSEPYQIVSEDQIITSVSGENNLWGATGTSGRTAVAPFDGSIIPQSFPKGYDGFYMMKYSISQQQYVDFLNTLTRTQQNNRTTANVGAKKTSIPNRFVMSNSATPVFRNGIACNLEINPTGPINFYCDLNNNGIGGEENDGLWIAANYLSWADGAAYTDWSGLRPMTELEYEKAARGTLAPVANEFAWGTKVVNQVSSLMNIGTSSELANGNGNAVYGDPTSFQGPIRVGAMATPSSNRETSGASYYGIMELSGNLWERTVTVANEIGLLFDGRHGDGLLSLQGNANVENYPGTIDGQVVHAIGSGFRGGAFNTSSNIMKISARNSGGHADIYRLNGYGFRAVRTTP